MRVSSVQHPRWHLGAAVAMLLLVGPTSIVLAFPKYQAELPNIPACCPGVGHVNPTGKSSV
jgi:hypothetical protein